MKSALIGQFFHSIGKGIGEVEQSLIDIIHLAVAIWGQLHETNLGDGRFRDSVVILEPAKITKPANSSLGRGRSMNLE